MAESFERLRELTALTETTPCTSEENQRFAQMKKNGEQLPDDVAPSAQDDTVFFHIKQIVPKENEQQYLLMRISNDLHSISTLLKVMLVLGIISALAAVIISAAA